MKDDIKDKELKVEGYLKDLHIELMTKIARETKIPLEYLLLEQDTTCPHCNKPYSLVQLNDGRVKCKECNWVDRKI